MVKWVKLGDCTDIVRGKRLTKSQIMDVGTYPVISGGVTPMGYFNEYNRDENTITVSQYGTAGYVDYQHTKFWANDICYCVYPYNYLVNRYLWYVLKSKQSLLYSIRNTEATPYSLPINTLKSIEIPLPSLSEQQRIVDILDKFEGMVENVEKELLLRQKQYEFYREKMMNCLRCDSVKWVKIGDEGSFYSGLSGKNKNDFVNGNAKFVTYMNVYTNVALNFDIEDKVQIRDTERQNTIEYGDILFTGSSETPDECGMSCVVTQVPEESIYLNSFCFGYRFNSIENILPDYCKHLFRSSMIRSAIAKTANGVTRFNVSKKLFANIEIPVPSLSKQQEIVAKLDKFEELINNLKEELELRKKQYEYYREKLLTFE